MKCCPGESVKVYGEDGPGGACEFTQPDIGVVVDILNPSGWGGKFNYVVKTKNNGRVVTSEDYIKRNESHDDAKIEKRCNGSLYFITVDGDAVYQTKDAYEASMFYAELKARLGG